MNLEKGKAVKNLLILLPMVILMAAGSDSIVEQEKQTTIAKQLSTVKPETIMLDASPIDLAEIEAFYTCDIWDKTKLKALLLTDMLVPPLRPKTAECRYSFNTKSKKMGNALSRFMIKFSFSKKENHKDGCDVFLSKGGVLQNGFKNKVVSYERESADEYDPFVSETLVACTDKVEFNLYISGPDQRYASQMRRLLRNVLSRM
ncbi:MAG TPA: hypothetical protein EYH20_07830 [Leucothrix sp.]|nr:hypothetical protein [Leucothrix sp.]